MRKFRGAWRSSFGLSGARCTGAPELRVHLIRETRSSSARVVATECVRGSSHGDHLGRRDAWRYLPGPPAENWRREGGARRDCLHPPDIRLPRLSVLDRGEEERPGLAGTFDTQSCTTSLSALDDTYRELRTPIKIFLRIAYFRTTFTTRPMYAHVRAAGLKPRLLACGEESGASGR